MTDPCPIVLESLPTLLLTQRRLLPMRPGIYLAISKEGSILYIGQSRNLHNRWIYHDLHQQLIALGCTVLRWYECPIEQMNALETQLIQHYQPLLNRKSDSSFPRNKVTIFMSPEEWHAFRVACLARHTSGSHEIRRLIQEQLTAWNIQDKETDHA
jgi:excinuclease UvrABC nuclease subunit